jgi:hypothetical protein
MSEAQQLLEQGKHLIVTFEGYWHMILPPSSWVAGLMGDHIFRTGFTSDVPEEEVREFYVERLNVGRDDVVRAV